MSREETPQLTGIATSSTSKRRIVIALIASGCVAVLVVAVWLVWGGSGHPMTTIAPGKTLALLGMDVRAPEGGPSACVVCISGQADEPKPGSPCEMKWSNGSKTSTTHIMHGYRGTGAKVFWAELIVLEVPNGASPKELVRDGKTYALTSVSHDQFQTRSRKQLTAAGVK